jgi:hypothetical protein
VPQMNGGEDINGNGLVLSIQNKVREAIERTEHLISLVPENYLDWHPEGRAENFSDIGHLLGHLLLCLGGFCSVIGSADVVYATTGSRMCRREHDGSRNIFYVTASPALFGVMAIAIHRCKVLIASWPVHFR